ncbi:MAG: DUF2080 family transposase-associated protein [Candidatus Heimdallarchaeota archaeon]|nr:DUF2080 family transposase-associated protein [Candidatus Heimdallarchaeota archaeon]
MTDGPEESKKVERKKTDDLVSIILEGYELIEKTVKSSGNTGRIYLPTSWIGSKVKVIRVTPKLTDDDS